MDNLNLYLDAVLKNVDQGILIVDQHATIKYYNQKASHLIGIPSSKVINQNVLDVFPGLTQEQSFIYQVLESGMPLIDVTQRSLEINSITQKISASVFPIKNKSKEIIGAVEYYKDITVVEELSEIVRNLQSVLFSNKRKHKQYQGNGTRYTFDDILFKSPKMEQLVTRAQKVANSTSPILIYGETGTGKELLVQAIHNANTKRVKKPFIAQNCAAIPRSLLESILFGTTSGSFTGAQDKPGLFELANGGTLFLDEINSMDIELQAKLLRVIQEGIVRRIGDSKMIEVDVRIVASTNEEPNTLITEGKMRVDLYYRLNVISLKIPPLRERKEDIELLISNFIEFYNRKFSKQITGISEKVLELFTQYPWPGNVRELLYTFESIMNFVEDTIIQTRDLPAKFLSYETEEEAPPLEEHTPDISLTPLKESVINYEKSLIMKAIKLSNGNRAEAARMLEIPTQTMYNKINKYGLSWKVIDSSTILYD